MDYKKITIGKLVDEIAAQNPETDAMVYVDRGLRLNYREFREECRTVARGLMSLGIRKGDHVGIWATNVPEWVVLQFASARIGAILITINTQYRPFELEYILRQSDTKLLVLSDGFKDISYPGTLFEVCPEVRDATGGRIRSEKFPHLRNVVHIGEKRFSWMLNWEEMKAKAEETSIRALDAEEASCEPEDVIFIMYTSGTTGFPKGAMLWHRNLVANGANIGDCMNLTPSGPDVHPRPVLPLLRLRHGASPARSRGARRWCRWRCSRPRPFSRRRAGSAAPRSTACRRCSSPSWRSSQGTRSKYDLDPAHRDHGRVALPDRGDARGDEGDALHARSPSPTGSPRPRPVITMTRFDDPIELRRDHRRPRPCRNRGQDRGPDDRKELPTGRAGASSRPAATT